MGYFCDIFFPVGTPLEGYALPTCLAARDDDWLAEVLQHEGECRGGVGEGVSAMQDNEAIEVLIGALDILRNDNPVIHGHVARVQQRIVLVDGVDHPSVNNHAVQFIIAYNTEWQL